jgi:hypothetical protein
MGAAFDWLALALTLPKAEHALLHSRVPPGDRIWRPVSPEPKSCIEDPFVARMEFEDGCFRLRREANATA